MSYYGTEREIIENLERALADAVAALKIANASADDQMFQKREAQAQRDTAREDALEQAAKLCDSEATCEDIAQKCAAAIRAMKECAK